ncbi:MAG: hypothetical protein Q9173_005838 [Seirophora scorigena]
MEIDFCILATIGAIGFAAVSISLARQQVIGRHQWNVPVSRFSNDVLRKLIVVDIIYPPAILMAKLSLLVLYLEVFRPSQKMRYAIYFGIVFTTAFYTGSFIAFCVMAIPRPGQSLIQVLYSNEVALLIPLSFAMGAVNVASDFYIFLLPIPAVCQLQLATKKKIGYCAIFGTGFLACLASIMGLYYRTKLKADADVTWTLVDVLIWVVVEMTVGIMCGCMPAFAAFFRHHLPLLRSIGSFFISKAKSLKLPKLSGRSSRPSSSESSKRLATKDIKMTLGSQVDGHGRFMNPTSVIARDEDWARLGQMAHNPPSVGRKPAGTRREWHEGMAEIKRQSLSSHPPTSMSRKPSVQTQVRRLPVHDEEKGALEHEVHDDKRETSPNTKGYF